MGAHARHEGPCLVEVVDDDDDIREGLRELLEDEGYVVCTAADGHEALDKMTVRRPCIVLLDLMMPKMNGWQVVQEMRARKLEVPVCVVTAMRQYAPQDVVCVLPKPLDIGRLLSVVENQCAEKND